MTNSLHTPAPAAPVAAATACVLRAVDVKKSIDERMILHGLSFDVPPGQCVALLGVNGAGKSTLLRILALLTTPTHGHVELFGQQVTRANGPSLRIRIGMIGHQAMLYRDLSAIENLVFFGQLYNVPDPRRRAVEMLERVGLSHRADDPVRALSRGMNQRVAIARALMHAPDLLLADEPFAGLDVPSTRSLERLLAQLRDEGKTLIVSSHDIHQAIALSNRVIVIRKGRIGMDAPAAGLTADRLVKELDPT